MSTASDAAPFSTTAAPSPFSLLAQTRSPRESQEYYNELFSFLSSASYSIGAQMKRSGSKLKKSGVIGGLKKMINTKPLLRKAKSCPCLGPRPASSDIELNEVGAATHNPLRAT